VQSPQNKSAAEKISKEGRKELRIACEVYSRIVGYLRPLSAWYAGKQQEFEDRVVYRLGVDYGREKGGEEKQEAVDSVGDL